MLKTLRLCNFQGHKDSVLNLAPGLNAIVGPSDGGKSSLIRAPYWVAFNRPIGEGMRRDGTKRTEVILEFDDVANPTKRIRTASKNEYRQGGVGELGGIRYEGFGQNVPEEIQKVLRLALINFQMQHDQHFLLANSAGEVARQLNEAADLEVIDRALSSINRKHREIQQQEGVLVKQTQEAEEVIVSFAWLDDTRNTLDHAELVQQDMVELQQNIRTLDSLIVRFFEAQKRTLALEPVLSLEKTLLALQTDHFDWLDLSEDYCNLKAGLDKAKDLQKQLKPMKAVVALESRALILSRKIWEMDKQGASLVEQESVYASWKHWTETVELAEERLTEAEAERDRIMPDVCPLCNQLIPKREQK